MVRFNTAVSKGLLSAVSSSGKSLFEENCYTCLVKLVSPAP
ncbi:hypothetical protein S7335_595 [Synechococcus sp. PCC 7335]|nr:hypothetical protein S7335_595 [Synechococcus sp. PCC 7335]